MREAPAGEAEDHITLVCEVRRSSLRHELKIVAEAIGERIGQDRLELHAVAGA